MVSLTGVGRMLLDLTKPQMAYDETLRVGSLVVKLVRGWVKGPLPARMIWNDEGEALCVVLDLGTAFAFEVQLREVARRAFQIKVEPTGGRVHLRVIGGVVGGTHWVELLETTFEVSSEEAVQGPTLWEHLTEV